MDRRERARQKKRKDRERRLRKQKHAAHAQPSGQPAEDASPADEPHTGAEAEPVNLFPHVRWHYEERLLRRVARVLARHADADQAERERVAAALKDKSPEELDGEFGTDDVERAQDLAFRAWDTENSDEMFTLLGEALKLDSTCTDARTLRALMEPRERDAIERLGYILDDAARGLGGESALPAGPGLWLDVRVRPYLRARHERMKLLADVGRTTEAIAEGEALLALDPGDGVQAHVYLCGALLELDQLVRARELMERFGIGAGLMWAHVLERFLSGLQREAAIRRRHLARNFPGVEELILGQPGPIYRDDETTAAIDEMAHDVLAPVARAWAKHDDARRWLEDGAPETTPAERAAAVESYGPPVSALLRLGETDESGPGDDGSRWPDYSLVHDLHADDIPELLRMAADPGLFELDAHQPAAWAPFHAGRALALSAAAGIDSARAVKDVVLARLRNDPDDILTHEDAIHVLALVGEAALDDLREILADRNEPASLRGSVVGCLAALGLRHPALREAALHSLSEALRDYVEEAEANVAEGYPADNVTEDEDLDTLAFVISALMRLRGGTGDGREKRVELVERAFATGVVDEDICGTADDVLTELRAEPAP